MKRAILIIMTVAVLGALGVYVQKNPGSSLGSGTKLGSGQPSSGSGSSSSIASSSGTGSSSPVSYKDGTFQGSSVDTPYGTVQIAVVVSGGKITDVNFLQMPSDQGHSRDVTAYAEPLLKQNTLQVQSANIDFVSGATITSSGYEQSLQAALNRAVSA